MCVYMHITVCSVSSQAEEISYKLKTHVLFELGINLNTGSVFFADMFFFLLWLYTVIFMSSPFLCWLLMVLL